MKSQISSIIEGGSSNASVRSREDSIDKILSACAKKKKQFKNITVASEYIAAELALIEGSNASGSTIRRNDFYRIKVENYLHSISKKSKNVGDKQEILHLQIAVRKLQTENSALESLISTQSSKIAAMEYLVNGEQLDVLMSKTPVAATSEGYFLILDAVMKAAKGFNVDLIEGRVIDETTEMVIFSKRDLPDFFDWYKKYHFQ